LGNTAEDMSKAANTPDKIFFGSEQYGIIKLTDYVGNMRKLVQAQPFCFTKSGQFWIWDRTIEDFLPSGQWIPLDEVDMQNFIEESFGFGNDLCSRRVREEYLNMAKRVGRKNIPPEPAKEWVQFKNAVFNIATGEVDVPTSKSFWTNKLPHNLGNNSDCLMIDRLFTEWVGVDRKQDLYEFIAYSCYASYPIHSLLALVGTGRNGKSSFLKLLKNFLGSQNVVTSSLHNLEEKNFERIKLYRKKVCIIEETKYSELDSTDNIKKLTGDSMIDFEAKYKDGFSAYNACKIVIASNGLPESPDTQDAWYRRWHILSFPNTFAEGKDIIEEVPETEYESLAKKVTEVLPLLLSNGRFSSQGTIEERKRNYILASNPLEWFIEQFCETGDTSFYYILATDLYSKYMRWLLAAGRRVPSKKAFFKTLDHIGLTPVKTNKKPLIMSVHGVMIPDRSSSDWQVLRWVEGVRMKSGFEAQLESHLPHLTICPISEKLSSKPCVETLFQTQANGANGANGINDLATDSQKRNADTNIQIPKSILDDRHWVLSQSEKLEMGTMPEFDVWLPCATCGWLPTDSETCCCLLDGKPVCEACFHKLKEEEVR
jgi:P4 family phage/plasmid primase-like protien